MGYAGPPLSEGDLRILKDIVRGGATSAQGLDENFDLTGGNIITGSSEAKRFELYGTGAQSGKAWVMYVHSDGTFRFTCLVSGVEENCDKEVKLITGKSFIVRNNGGTPVLTLTEAGMLSSIIVKEEVWFDMAGCDDATGVFIFNKPTANAPTATCEGTNTRIATLDFDATTDQSFTGRWRLPTGFQSSLGINIPIRWKAASTSGSTGWCFQMVRVPDGATSDPALPAQAAGNCVSDTAKGTTLQENEATITNVTCTSCVAGDAVNWVFSRDANGSAVTDDMTGLAKGLQFGRILWVQK
jgi:hypothetical protein